MDKCMNEITRTDFWKLEDKVKDKSLEKTCGGEIMVTFRGDDKLYYNFHGNWLMSHEGIYFANKKLMKLLR